MRTVFVSSTFRDMHFERDVLHELVTPALNAEARAFGESVAFCDLRWGVNTGELESEEGSRKVLSVCLGEIDRCRPYMVVLPGERYGWIPDEALIADAAGSVGIALDELEKSVTALEIEYGALADAAQLERTLFYFRELEGGAPDVYRAEDARHAEKLAQLKARIQRLAGGRLRTYALRWDGAQGAPEPDGLAAFAQMVEQDLRALMEVEWRAAAALTPLQRDQRAQWDYAEQRSRQFGAREGVVAEALAALDSGTNLLALTGESGSGKSTLMARLAHELRARGDWALPIFCSTTELTGDAMEVVRYVVGAVEERLGLPSFADAPREAPAGEREWTERLAEVVAAWEGRGEGRLVVLLDAVDQLLDDDARARLAFVPPNLSGRAQLVLSCLDGRRLGRPVPALRVEPLGEKDRPAVVASILRFLGRELDRPVIDAIVRKPAAGSPLYLSVLLQRLTMMDRRDFEDIAARAGAL